jgi:lipoprotein-anchoring transpeptidase ErfK/SrfK
MKSSSLESKTVRPGLAMYNFYRSDRHPASQAQQTPPPVAATKPRAKFYVIALVVLVAIIGLSKLVDGGKDTPNTQAASSGTATTKHTSTPAVVTAQNECKGNVLNKLIMVDITARHLWACERGKSVQDTPVITGIEKYDSTRTPPGTYHIYAKTTDTTLNGSDETGSWSDPVYYWMPFLDNQYGTYGFHDATWRKDSEFGSVNPYAENADASHGCVELPLGASKALYSWAEIGTTVTVKA